MRMNFVRLCFLFISFVVVFSVTFYRDYFQDAMASFVSLDNLNNATSASVARMRPPNTTNNLTMTKSWLVDDTTTSDNPSHINIDDKPSDQGGDDRTTNEVAPPNSKDDEISASSTRKQNMDTQQTSLGRTTISPTTLQEAKPRKNESLQTAPNADTGASVLEVTPWSFLFLPLRNVCFSRNHLHFFQTANDDDNDDNNITSTSSSPSSTTTMTLSGAAARDYFVKNKEGQEIWISFTLRSKYFDPTTVLHYNMSMQQWSSMENTTKGSQVTFYPGTSFVVTPHLPNNMFHVFNDLIVPLFRTALYSGSIGESNNVNNNDNDHENISHDKKKTSIRNVFLLRGNRDYMKNTVIMFDVLYKLFHNVKYPFEDLVAPLHDSISQKVVEQIACFERFVWVQNAPGARRPYYDHAGRFDSARNNQWKGVVPALRDAINRAYNISVPSRNVIRQGKPRLVWASRTNDKEDTCDRCIVNEKAFLKAMEEKFEVHLLPIADRRVSRETNLIQALQLMATADILGGLHGAGLGHAVFLQPGTVLFEMRDRSHWNKNLFMNMASLNDAAYYTFDTRPFEKPRLGHERYVLENTTISEIVDGLFEGWRQEAEHWQLNKTQSILEQAEQNPCKFPSLSRLAGRVSTFNSSRCYLIPTNINWKQATDGNYED